MKREQEENTQTRERFYERRAKRLRRLDNGAKVCRLNHMDPSLDMLEEAVKVGYELLEALHSNNVQEKLCTLLEKATEVCVDVKKENATKQRDKP